MGEAAPSRSYNTNYNYPTTTTTTTTSTMTTASSVSFRSTETRDEIKNFSLHLRQCAVLNNDAEMTSLLLVHPYESLLVVADEKDQLSLWTFEQSEKLLSFGNKNPSGYVTGCCDTHEDKAGQNRTLIRCGMVV